MGNWIRLRRALLTLAIFSLLIGISSAPSQIAAQEGLAELLTLNINAGFDGRFRLNQWMPVHVEINNQGDAITGRIVVRPETSGNALLNTFSAPVELPRNSSDALSLYHGAQ
jgi:hypothetical protein